MHRFADYKVNDYSMLVCRQLPLTGAAVSNLLGTEAGQTAAFALPFLTSPGVRSRMAFGLDALAKMDDPFRYRGIMSALYGGEQANEKVEKTKKRNGR